jgi:hypothetical protein
MKPTPFKQETDLPPIPFDIRHCTLANELKNAGLIWKPRVGCFVWDKDDQIGVDSPFPGNIYFILNLGQFLRFFGTNDKISKALVWLPTWYQARLLCNRYDVDGKGIKDICTTVSALDPAEELLEIYKLILENLHN